MKIESIASQKRLAVPAEVSAEEASVIQEDEIKSILYLGVRGDISYIADKKHAVDTFA
jgi:hypothetical protein